MKQEGERLIFSLKDAADIYDGENRRWFRDIVPGSVEVDEERGIVSFTVRWHGRKEPTKTKVTLRIETVSGLREDPSGLTRKENR